MLCPFFQAKLIVYPAMRPCAPPKRGPRRVSPPPLAAPHNGDGKNKDDRSTSVLSPDHLYAAPRSRSEPTSPETPSAELSAYAKRKRNVIISSCAGMLHADYAT